jgi:hypothetical protein
LLVLDILKTEKKPRSGSFYFLLRQDKFESILEIKEYVVSSPFVKAEADSDRLFCTVFETVCASSLAMCGYVNACI